nr:leucyl aminopeptidase family protein [uncultured Eisenbergiella sp.]
MISVVKKKNETYSIDFVWEKDAHIRSYRMGLEKVFGGKYLESMLVPLRGQAVLLAGCGKEEELGLVQVKEITAAVSRRCKELHIGEISLDPGFFVKKLGKKAVTAVVQGLGLGGYSYTYRKTEKDTASDCNFQLENMDGFADSLQEGLELLNGILFARDMVNTPGNHLRPMDFARKITDYVDGGDVETELLVYGQLRALRLEALYGVGGSSEYPPCLLILRYRGAPGSGDIYGLIGKGITCDTGGYCLKESSSMAGIKGDMAGAAAVAAAVHAAAARKLKVNITACLPLSENRISQSALLPGDVITGYSGRTIEVLNTDAEGRLVLSDAISYGICREGITKVLDIATLTGAVAQMLGNTIGGTMSDDEAFYHMFERAQTFSAERYLRLPFGKEHEKMIDSDVADVRNIGGGCCGTITAGLFLRRFCEGKPWIHMDIAGTAWCGTPTYAFESKGATGAGVTTLYYLMKEAQL